MYEETIAGLRKIVQDYKGRLTPWMRVTIAKAADAIEDLIAALTASNEVIVKNKPRWIPVAERLPEKRKAVLIWERHYPNAYSASLFDDGWYIFGGCGVKIVLEPTHWMPLPKPPKEET